jgi:3-oxoacyl-[acyl-carrier-protein] synthase-3
MQDRLGIPKRCGALDFNLGCSGFVYGLALADGLIRTLSARRVLLITAETYTRFIDAQDRSLRTIFGDGAAATLIEAADQPTITGYCYGTDGSGADTLMVTAGGHRRPPDAHTPRHRQRWKSDLYMDGPSLINFTVEAVPELVDQVLAATGLTMQQVDLFLMHQATLKMMQHLLQRLELTEARMPIVLDKVGNSVSSTIPIVIVQLRRDGRLAEGTHSMLVGFGVGWSWAGCMWRESWSA